MLSRASVATQGHETKHLQWFPAVMAWAYGEEWICFVSSFKFLTKEICLQKQINAKRNSNTSCSCAYYYPFI